jgi:hypothetical protein
MSFAEDRLKDIKGGILRFNVGDYTYWTREVVDPLAELIADGVVSVVTPIYSSRRGEKELVALQVTAIPSRQS